MRILIAEDELTSRTILSATLKKGGHDVVEVADGVDAWDEVRKEDAPRLLVLDWMMPKMDGIDVVRRVRELNAPIPLYIIMLTAKSEKSDTISALSVGANDILNKPFDSGELLARVQVGSRMIEIQEKLVSQADKIRDVHFQLAHAQKLEAVGQLAAGIAHEINTPTQFVSDSIHFIQDAFEDLKELRSTYETEIETLTEGKERDRIMGVFEEARETADVEYLEENVPGSFSRCLEGLSRISKIVSAMKEFAHPDVREKSIANINQAIQSTLIIAKNEYKYVADTELDLGELPPVECHLGDLNQVFLNLIVNAAHAIGNVVGDTGEKGVIRIRTLHEGKDVCIEIGDTGSGIPEGVRDRIFEPFFTTKAVGKGSGQGLAIAHSIIVDKHQGSLAFETADGAGTTFSIRIPVNGGSSAPEDGKS